MHGAELAQNGGDADGVRPKGGESRRFETPGGIAASTIPADVGVGGHLHHHPAKIERPKQRIGSAEILLPPRLLVGKIDWAFLKKVFFPEGSWHREFSKTVFYFLKRRF